MIEKCVEFISHFLRMLVCKANYLFLIEFKAKFANELLQKRLSIRECTRVGFKILRMCSEIDVHTLNYNLRLVNDWVKANKYVLIQVNQR